MNNELGVNRIEGERAEGSTRSLLNKCFDRKCYFQPSDQKTDRQGHREATHPIIPTSGPYSSMDRWKDKVISKEALLPEAYTSDLCMN